MYKKVTTILLTSVFVLSMLVACGKSSTSIASTAESAALSTENIAANVSTEATTVAVTAAEAITEHSTEHENAADYQWEGAAVIPVTLQGDSISVDGDGATAEGSTVTITAAGTYRLSGSLADGQIAVDTDDAEVVRLILNGIDVHNATSAAINVIKAEKVVIILADQTKNYLSDGESYVFADPAVDEPNATLFSKADLTLSSPALVKGASYEVYVGGAATGTVTDGLYQEGSYTPGTEYTSFTIADIVTTIGTSRR